MASGGKPLGRSLLARTGMFLILGATGEVAWEHVVDFCCQRRSHVASKFLFFTLVFLDQPALVGLGHVLAALAANLVNRPEHDLFGGAVARAAVAREVADISASDVGRTIDGKRHTVGDFPLPSLCVETGLIPGAFAGVNVYPSSLVFGVNFGPDVVLGVPDPADSGADRAAKHAEAVGPFANSATAGLEQLPHIGVSGESFVGGTAVIRASVEFDAGRTTGGLIGAGWSHALRDGGHVALGARRVVDKLEEGSLEPSGALCEQGRRESRPLENSNIPEQCTDDTILVAPFRLP